MQISGTFLTKARATRCFGWLCLVAVCLFVAFESSDVQENLEPRLLVDRSASYTAHRTHDADYIQARSGRFHISGDRKVTLTGEWGSVIFLRGEAQVDVGTDSLVVAVQQDNVIVQTDWTSRQLQGTEPLVVEEGWTMRWEKPSQDSALTSLGMCE
jgi:hypothetical protein